MTNSNDVSLMVEIDGVPYRVINSRLEALESSTREIHHELREMHSEIRSLSEEIHMLAVRVQGIESRIDDMKFYVSLSFGALAVFVALIVLVPIVSKVVQALRKPALTVEQVSAMIHDALAQTQAVK